LIAPLVDKKKVLVCLGPGGVGKTTTAAAVGALAARRGRRTLVCTIDPAPRLADALGTGGLGPDPRPVPPDARRALGIDTPEPWQGSGPPAMGSGGRSPSSPDAISSPAESMLSAVRIDTERTFGKLVTDAVADPDMRRRIFDNTLYRQITTMLTGSQEYAATLALHDFVVSGQWDLVVLDTPPTTNALDFLDAPNRIAAAVSSPALKWFARPQEGERRFSLQRLRSGGALLVRRLAKLVGSNFLDDAGAFLVDFQDALAGFLVRAKAVDRLLRGPDVGFLLVLAPVVASVDEALYFHGRLRDAGIQLAGFVANRVQPRAGLTETSAIAAALRAEAAFAGLPPGTIDDAAARLGPIAQAFGELHASERRQLARLGSHAAGISITEVPLFDHGVDNLAELRVVGEHLSSG
jgi:anion-transporting  ArsA/GET3 family ATPase